MNLPRLAKNSTWHFQKLKASHRPYGFKWWLTVTTPFLDEHNDYIEFDIPFWR